MATVDTLLTAEQYALLPEIGRPTELIRGRIIEMNPPGPWHGYVCGTIYFLVRTFVGGHDLGRVISNDSGVITERGPDTVRGADVCYYSFQRLPRGELQPGYVDVVPELIFEVRSQYDRWVEMLRKAAEYLNAGVLVVCLVDPPRKRVMVCEKDEMPRILGADEVLTLPTVLPGFEVLVARLFE